MKKDSQVPVRRSWVPVPAWWFPVWISLDATEGRRDALLLAIERFVALGVGRADGIASELCLPTALVESAMGEAIARGRLRLTTAGQLEVVPDDTADEQPVDDPGWIAWDPRAGRPLLHLWGDARLPPEGPRAEGWQVQALPPTFEHPPPPGDDRVIRALQVLGHAPEVSVLQPAGVGVRRDESARVRRVRRRLDEKRRRGWIWAPVEHRVHGTVVWRPSPVPTPEVEGELDPGGWDQLAAMLHDDHATEHERTRKELFEEIAPGVLHQAGFESIEALRKAARKSTERALPNAREWGPVVVSAEEAYMQEKLAEALEADWNVLARGWAEVLEVLTRELAEPCIPALRNLRRAPQWSAEDMRRLHRRLGSKTWKAVKKTLGDRHRLAELKQAAKDQTDSIGTRLLFLGAAIATESALERAFAPVFESEPKFFELLDRATAGRNAVVHRRADRGDLHVPAFREVVLKVCSAALQLDRSVLDNRDR